MCFGGVGGAIVTAAFNLAFPAIRRRRLWKGLEVSGYNQSGQVVTLLVRNKDRVLSITDCWACISLSVDQGRDILSPPGGRQAHIRPDALHVVEDERLCWSVVIDGKCPPEVDIRSGVPQSLQLCDVLTADRCIGLFSESRHDPYRVFLRDDKQYSGHVDILGKGLRPKRFKIRLGPVTGSRCHVQIEA
jgi:hypothetical protein